MAHDLAILDELLRLCLNFFSPQNDRANAVDFQQVTLPGVVWDEHKPGALTPTTTDREIRRGVRRGLFGTLSPIYSRFCVSNGHVSGEKFAVSFLFISFFCLSR